jgi:Uri superfamily endonuclease
MIKPGPGTYALIMKADDPFELAVGKLGLLKGRADYYVYCGSAFGPGGIRARMAKGRE